MSPLPLLAGAAVLLLVSRKRGATRTVQVPTAPEVMPQAPDVPPVIDPSTTLEDVVVSADTFYIVQPGDTLVELARHWTGDPNRWRELRDQQPSRKRRAQLSAGIIQPGQRLLIPQTWPIPDDVPQSQLESYTRALQADPEVAK